MAIPPSGAGQKSSKSLLLLVLAATTIAYVWTLHFGFVYDDLGQIVSNPLVQSWRFLPEYFHGNVWMQQSAVGNYYRPLFLIWLLLNHTCFGLHPALWHLTTLLTHLCATALVYMLALRLTQRQSAAAIAAAIFGVHPAHVESVAWISGATDSLLALLIIPAFLAFMNYREKKENKWLAISVGFYALGLLSKETAVVLPVLVAAYVVFSPAQPWKDRLRDAIVAVIPFALVTIPYLLARAAALHGVAHETAEITPAITFYTVPSVLWFYIQHLMAPVRLSAFYDTPYVTHVSWKYFLAPLLGVLVTFAVLLAVWWKSRSQAVAIAIAWTFIPLLPVLDVALLPMGDFVHDRYLYLPVIGLGLLLGLALSSLDAKKLASRPLGSVAAVALIVVMIAGTIKQSLPWVDDIPLYAHGMQVAPINDLPRNKLAATYVARGMYEQGIAAYKFVLASDPDYWYANYRMGYAQYMTGHYDAAEPYLQKAASRNATPDILYYLGLNSAKLRRYDLAEAALRQAVKENPRGPGYIFALGTVLKDQGKLQPALELFRAELDLNPNDAGARSQIEELSAKLQSAKR